MAHKITPLDKHIADRLKAMRQERTVTQPGVAKSLGVSYQSYQKMERGTVSFRASTLDKLATLFDVPVAYFFGDGPPPDVRNGAEIACIASILGDLPTEAAKGVVEYAARAKGGLGAAIQA